MTILLSLGAMLLVMDARGDATPGYPEAGVAPLVLTAQSRQIPDTTRRDSVTRRGENTLDESDPRTLTEESLALTNEPNPFNPGTTIRFYLAEPAYVTLTVRTLAGEDVDVLFAVERFDEGLQEVVFDGTGLPGGVYMCHLEVEPIAPSHSNVDEPISAYHMMLLK